MLESVQNVITAWRSIKDLTARKEVISQLQSLVASAEIEQELNRESSYVTDKMNGLEGSINDETKHYVLAGDNTTEGVVGTLMNADLYCDLIFTSPPYNAGIEYDKYEDNKNLEDYLTLIDRFAHASNQLLRPGGSLILNLRDLSVGRGSRFPIIYALYETLKKIDYTYRGLHIWYKGREESSFAWGSFKSSNNPSIIDLYEYIYVFQKPGEHANGVDNMCKTEFVENVIGVWKIRPTKKISGKSKKNIIGHPCPFPMELAKRVIKLYSHVGDMVYDPFAGIMNTTIAAADCGRSSIAVDISEDYCLTGRRRCMSYGVDVEVL